MKRDLVGRRIVITGASSGIGQALTHALAHRSTKLLLVARRTERLEQLAAEVTNAGSTVEYVSADLCVSSDRARVIKAAQDHYDGLDILINNAGIGGIGTFESADEARLRQIMEVNFFAPVELIRGTMDMLEKSNDGVVVNIGSVLGHCAVPKKSEYCASKFAMHGFTDSLRMELKDHGIDVLLVSPSTTQSEFFSVAMTSGETSPQNPYAMTAESVAQHVVRSIERGHREAILSWTGKLLVWSDRLFPGIVSKILTRYG